MKRILALALAAALIIAMGLEVSAATYGSGTVDFKDLHPGDVLQQGVTLTNETGLFFVRCLNHKIVAISATSIDADAIKSNWKNGSHNGDVIHFDSVAVNLQNKLVTGDHTIVDANGNIPQPAAKPQPKTGVMDTLPLWFGMMAVSACAYVLTSKKKVF